MFKVHIEINQESVPLDIAKQRKAQLNNRPKRIILTWMLMGLAFSDWSKLHINQKYFGNFNCKNTWSSIDSSLKTE